MGVSYELLHGDCLTLLGGVEPGSCDAIICDPPYGTTRNEWDKKIDLAEWWPLVWRAAKPTAPVLVFSQMPFAAELVLSAPKEYRYEWVWDKRIQTGFLNARRMPLRRHELIQVFYRQLPTYNPQMAQGTYYRQTANNRGGRNYGHVKDRKPYESCERFPTDILVFDQARNYAESAKDTNHPTQKPTDLLAYLVRTYTNAGETVLDPFMGSGSTGVACGMEGRSFVGMELDTHWFGVAESRVSQAYAQERLFEC